MYDCGTTSSQKLVHAAIAHLEEKCLKEDGVLGIDLVILSHFDRDHVSGVEQLMKVFDVSRLLLPYVPLWQRLVIAFGQGVDTQQDFMQFYIDPAQYLTSRSGGSETRVVFVPPADSDNPAEEPQSESPRSGDNGLLEVDWSGITGVDVVGGEFAIQQGMAGRTASQAMLKPGAAIRVGNLWELVPYNDASLAGSATKAFRDEVESLKAQLLSGGQACVDALKRVREIYDGTFGRTAEKRNLISLFLYGGQVRGANVSDVETQVWADARASSRAWWSHWHMHESRGFGLLYTGDGYLNTAQRISALTRFLGPRRKEQCTIFQVMHHGAQPNWCSGVAAKFKPDISVFSSDPAHKGLRHPDAAVVKDFLPFGPIQVDKLNGLEIAAEFFGP